jgi:pyruvate/2-oxoglutarate dehydrogenase complex dihydrolipoamide acyltransferase (E2) component
MPHLRLQEKKNLSSFRRIAIGTWETTKDPSVYGQIALPADKVLAYIEALKQRSGKRITLSHVMAKAAGMVMHEMPDANAILRFNKIYLREDIGVFFQVALEDPATGEIDLSGATVFDTHKKSVVEIVDDFDAKVGAVRSLKDKSLEQTRSTFKSIPAFMLNWILDVMSLFLYTLNLDMRRFGLPRDPFGSVMITNIGTLGLEEAYVPLVPYSKVPLLIALGAVKEEAVVEEGVVVVRKMLRVCATFDHRVLDGMHAAKMVKTLKRVFANPEAELGALPPA